MSTDTNNSEEEPTLEELAADVAEDEAFSDTVRAIGRRLRDAAQEGRI